MQTKEPRSFEETLKELEQTAAELDGDVGLEKALQLFERGIELSDSCDQFLKTARQRVDELKARAAK